MAAPVAAPMSAPMAAPAGALMAPAAPVSPIPGPSSAGNDVVA